MSFCIRAADKIIEVCCKGTDLKPYLGACLTGARPQLRLTLSAEEEFKLIHSPAFRNWDSKIPAGPEAASRLLIRKLSELLPVQNILLIRLPVIIVENTAFLLAVNENTLTSIDSEMSAQIPSAVYLTDYYAFIQCLKSGIYIYGTPWRCFIPELRNRPTLLGKIFTDAGNNNSDSPAALFPYCFTDSPTANAKIAGLIRKYSSEISDFIVPVSTPADAMEELTQCIPGIGLHLLK